MAEVTRAPLQSVGTGSLAKFWLGVLVGILVAGAIAWFISRPPSVSVETIAEGEGESPDPGDVVFVRYTGRLAESGEVFDQSQDAPWPVEGILPAGTPLPLEQMIPGFRDALTEMQRGGRYRVEIPSELGYGETPPPQSPIPPAADLEFEIELVDFMSPEEAEQRYQAMLQFLQQQTPAEGDAAGEGVSAPPQS